MDHLFSAFLPRWTSHNTKQNASCGDIPDLFNSTQAAKKHHNGALEGFDNKYSVTTSLDRVKSMSNTDLVNDVDEQLMQIKEKLSAFREQDNQFRERIKLLSNSVNELSSRSSLNSFTPSEYSNLDSMDEASNGGEEFEQQTTRAFSIEPPKLLRIPTVRVTGCRDHFNQSSVGCFHMRRATSDPISIHSLLSEEAQTIETTQLRSSHSTEAINLYPQYNNTKETSTLF